MLGIPRIGEMYFNYAAIRQRDASQSSENSGPLTSTVHADADYRLQGTVSSEENS